MQAIPITILSSVLITADLVGIGVFSAAVLKYTIEDNPWFDIKLIGTVLLFLGMKLLGDILAIVGSWRNNPDMVQISQRGTLNKLLLAFN